MKYTVLLLISIFFFSCDTNKPTEENTAEVTTLYFIRHAEKNRDNPDEKDPALTDAGTKRAERWSAILKNIDFDAVYATDYKRTQQTAQPTAKSNDLNITSYPPEQLDVENIYKQGYHNVLVVGHSNTVPKLVNTLTGKNAFQDIEDSNNGNLYIVTLKNKKAVSVNLLTIN